MIDALLTNTSPPVDGEALFLNLLPWLGVILLLVVILVGTIYIGRQLLNEGDAGSEQPFTLQSLRELHAAGELSDDEFQSARDAMIAQVKAAAQRDAAGEGRQEAHEDDASKKATDADDESTDEDADEHPGESDNCSDEKPRGD